MTALSTCLCSKAFTASLLYRHGRTTTRSPRTSTTCALPATPSACATTPRSRPGPPAPSPPTSPTTRPSRRLVSLDCLTVMKGRFPVHWAFKWAASAENSLTARPLGRLVTYMIDGIHRSYTTHSSYSSADRRGSLCFIVSQQPSMLHASQTARSWVRSYGRPRASWPCAGGKGKQHACHYTRVPHTHINTHTAPSPLPATQPQLPFPPRPNCLQPTFNRHQPPSALPSPRSSRSSTANGLMGGSSALTLTFVDAAPDMISPRGATAAMRYSARSSQLQAIALQAAKQRKQSHAAAPRHVRGCAQPCVCVSRGSFQPSQGGADGSAQQASQGPHTPGRAALRHRRVRIAMQPAVLAAVVRRSCPCLSLPCPSTSAARGRQA